LCNWKFERQFTEIGEEKKGIRHLPWISNEKFKEMELTIHRERRKKQ
jgi:hypothetical protein